MISTLPQYIEIRQNRAGKERPFLIGTRIRVQDIVIDHERFGHTDADIIRNYPHLSLAQVHAALLFYFEDREAIWHCIREDEAVMQPMQSQQLTWLRHANE
jgi:uncharacterized protein (DUF433 family)